MANISTSYYDDFQPTLAKEQWVSKAETYWAKSSALGDVL